MSIKVHGRAPVHFQGCGIGLTKWICRREGTRHREVDFDRDAVFVQSIRAAETVKHLIVHYEIQHLRSAAQAIAHIEGGTKGAKAAADADLRNKRQRLFAQVTVRVA